MHAYVFHFRFCYKILSAVPCAIQEMFSCCAQSLSCVWLFETHWLLCPWNFPGKNPRVGCHFILQGIFLTQGLNLCLLSLQHLQAGSLPLCYLGSQEVLIFIYCIHSSVYTLMPNAKCIPPIPFPFGKCLCVFSMSVSLLEKNKLYFNKYSLLFSVEGMHMIWTGSMPPDKKTPLACLIKQQL